MPEGMVIVGAGECGARAALALREAGHDGPVTLIGEEEHDPYERPPLSKSAITAPDPRPATVADRARLAQAGIAFLPGRRVAAIDPAARRVTLADGAALPYAKLLLATGARPRPLPLPGADGPNALTLRTVEDAARIRAAIEAGGRLAVIGGGFIGLEIAASARACAAAVTVIEAQPRLLTRCVPSEIADALEARHRAEGTAFVLGAAVERLSPEGVHLAGGRLVPADLVVIGIGAIPNTALAEAAGLSVANGILTDAHLRTADPHIYAAGDCAAFPLPSAGRLVRLESWRSAGETGTLAARNMAGQAEPLVMVPWFWSDQFGLTLQVAGLPAAPEVRIHRQLGPAAFILFDLAPDGRLVAASGLGPGNAVAKEIRLAEMMIAKGCRPDPAALAAPETNLKKLLAA